jgi:hypothetical protein
MASRGRLLWRRAEDGRYERVSAEVGAVLLDGILTVERTRCSSPSGPCREWREWLDASHPSVFSPRGRVGPELDDGPNSPRVLTCDERLYPVASSDQAMSLFVRPAIREGRPAKARISRLGGVL